MDLRWWSSLNPQTKGTFNKVPPVDEPLCHLAAAWGGQCLDVIVWGSLRPHLPCWVPLSDLAAAIAGSHGGGEAGSAAARASVAALAAAHGSGFVWCPAFGSIQDALPLLSPSGSSQGLATPLPLFPPARETPLVVRGRAYGGLEQYVQVQKSQGTPDGEKAFLAMNGVTSSREALAVARRFAVAESWGTSAKIRAMSEAMRARILQSSKSAQQKLRSAVPKLETAAAEGPASADSHHCHASPPPLDCGVEVEVAVDLAALLASTAGRPLVFARSGDALWGTGKKHTGKNELGKLLERLRDSEVAPRVLQLQLPQALSSEHEKDADGDGASKLCLPTAEEVMAAVGSGRSSGRSSGGGGRGGGGGGGSVGGANAASGGVYEDVMAFGGGQGLGLPPPVSASSSASSSSGGVLLRRLCLSRGEGFAVDGCAVLVHYTGRLAGSTQTPLETPPQTPLEKSGSPGRAPKDDDGGGGGGGYDGGGGGDWRREFIFDSSLGHKPNTAASAISTTSTSTAVGCGNSSDAAAAPPPLPPPTPPPVTTRDPFVVLLGAGSVVEGWEHALRWLEAGECAEVVIKPRYAYGAMGRGRAIPPNSTLRFHLWVVDVLWPHQIAERTRTQQASKAASGGKGSQALGALAEESEEEDEEEGCCSGDHAHDHGHNHTFDE